MYNNQAENKPGIYLDLRERSERYLVLRREFEKAVVELKLTGAWELHPKKGFLDPKGEFKVDFYLK